MRTLVLSDLHLGSSTGADVLTDGRVSARLERALAVTDRVVFLGDLLELRHGPVSAALVAAQPVIERLGAALPPGAEVVIVPGNHDHDLIRPWLDARAAPLGLEHRIKPATASPLARRVAAFFPGADVRISYPGIWLREDVYAFHGHYLDVHTRVPTFERLAAGVMTKIMGGLPDGEADPDAYERILAPMYAWIHAAAQRARPGRLGAGAGSAGKAYEALHGDGHRPMRMRVLLAALPFGVRGLSMVGLGQLSSDLSAAGLLNGSLDAVAEAVDRLGIGAEHVVFGHSHRTGPLRNDDLLRWRTPGGAWLHNTGSWVHEPAFTAATSGKHPYWPGGALVIEDGRPPRLTRLLDGVRLPQAARSAPARPRG
ncbi:MAG: metallophosphoesterase [Baekduia sp.]